MYCMYNRVRANANCPTAVLGTSKILSLPYSSPGRNKIRSICDSRHMISWNLRCALRAAPKRIKRTEQVALQVPKNHQKC